MLEYVKKHIRKKQPTDLAEVIKADERLPSLLSDRFTPVMKENARAKYYMEKYKLGQSHVNQWNSFSAKVDFRGKRVLEIGGSNMPQELLFEDLGAEKWVCVDKVMPYQQNVWAEHYSQIKMFEKGEPPLCEALNNHNHICYKLNFRREKSLKNP